MNCYSMEQKAEKQLRAQLVNHLIGGEAFAPIAKLLEKMPFQKAGIVPAGLPYSFWQQFYHLKFTQADILEFSRNKNYKYPQWPEDYWSSASAPGNKQEWDQNIQTYFEERQQFCDLISESENSLFQPFTHGSGQTLLREALLVIEHTAYHTGEMLVILRLLGLHE